MKKKRTAKSKRPYIFCMILSLGLIVVSFFSVFMNNPHVLFRLQNILKPVQGEFIFHSLDEDDVSQIYQAQFNTAFDNIRITPLTSSAVDSKMARYSPDGQQIVYVEAPPANFGLDVYHAENGNIVLMSSNGQHKRVISQGSYARWIDNEHLFIIRRIGYYLTNMLYECPIYGVFELDLITMLEKQLFNIPDEARWIESKDEYNLGHNSYHAGCVSYFQVYSGESSFTSYSAPVLYDPSEVLEKTFVDNTLQYLINSEFSPDNSVQAFINDTRKCGHCNIERSGISVKATTEDHSRVVSWDDHRRLVSSQATLNLSWSPDGQFLIYDAKHPDGNTVIAITSVDGGFTYPLLGSDGLSYSAPHWKPN